MTEHKLFPVYSQSKTPISKTLLTPTPGVYLFLEGEHRNEQYWNGANADIEAISIYANSFKKETCI